MKVAETLTEAAFAERLDELLDRASRGEEFALERDGEVFAIVGPPPGTSAVTRGESVAKYPKAPRPDDQFADDLEAVRASQGVAERPE